MGCVSSRDASHESGLPKSKLSQQKEAASSALVAPQQTSPSTEPPKAEQSRAEPPTGLASDARGASGEAVASTGASGTAGASGTSVVSGASGAPGASEVSEASGASGASGVSGAPGVPGASNTSEASGVPGVSGASGVPGPPGVSGASGVSGVSAVSGTSGVSGVSGVSGTSGSSGSLLGSGGPGSSTGSGGRGASTRSLEPPADLTIPRLTEDEIKCVTRNFSTVLGEGGFGKVYKGEMRPCGASPNGPCRCPKKPREGGGGAGERDAGGSGGAEGEGGGGSKPGAAGMVERDAGGCKPIPVAVKVLAPHSFQGDYEFMTELVTFGAVRHSNIVELLAYSPHPSKALVYEFMPKGDVHALLARCKKGEATFPWAARLKVAHEVAQAVAFMHSLRYIHRDLKASNVLLTQDFTAKVADFGLAKGIADWRSHVTTRVVGSFGYMDPMYYLSGHVHAKSDVYAFGVFLVELLTGKSVLQDSIHEDLIPTLLHHDHPDLALLVDPAIAPECRRKDALAIAYIAKYALIKEWDARPSMQSVAQKIGNVVKWQKSRAEAAAAEEGGGGKGATAGGEAGGGEAKGGVGSEEVVTGGDGAAETPGAAAAAEVQSVKW
ncbi:unnamed protein product [Closterium sp. Yama58-4]|nr:unnamed protein product [Closterium sp. Yama58-4]